MFTIEYRQEVREKMISRARSDLRIVSAAFIGSYATGREDRWSDIDLTFGVNEPYTTTELIDSWTDYVLTEFAGMVLLDVSRGNTIYRVFILPGCLQVDLSFSPHSDFGAIGPNFKLLYGRQFDKPQPKPRPASELFGYIIHHILRARICMERERLWQAEFWLREARNYAMTLACLCHGLNPDYGRGYDDLPGDTLDLFADSIVKVLNRGELMRSLRIIVSALPKFPETGGEFSTKFKEVLDEISS